MTRKILIVDDISINRQILKSILCGEYDISEAANGEEALRFIKQNYKTLSAVLLDIVMTVMDGYELLRLVHENHVLSQIPIIVVTGSEDETSRVKALACGANDFITKPYNPDIIMHCLKNNIALHETALIVNSFQRDKLTGIYNREFFLEKAESLIKAGKPGEYIMAGLDIDNFKLINERFGSAECDRILKFIGATLKETVEHVGGLCGRISGDNFAAIYPNTPDVIAFVSEGYQSRYLPKDIPINIHISVGRYIVNDTALPSSTAYDRAYIAKRSVKGRYDMNAAYFDDSMLESLVRNQQITADMSAALSEGQFEVWFQPQYNHSTGALIGAEALARWRHPTKGMIQPGDFIPVFEQNGFIYELDKYVWEQVCVYINKWMDDGKVPLPVSVNISRYDLFRDDLVDIICSLCKKYGVPADLLRLEITESAYSESSERVIEIVEALIEHGFTIEIDDFGSGYSSLNTLKEVPAQILKLDMRFMDDRGKLHRGGNVLEAMVRMAKWLDMAVIAEGVETPEMADYLESIGCFYVQGYLYSKPMPAAAYENLARSSVREKRLFKMETVDRLDNNIFWSPDSIDTLIFNNYVGSACVFEFHRGRIELIRANRKFIEMIGSAGLTVDDAMKLKWEDYLDREAVNDFVYKLHVSVEKNDEVRAEYSFTGLPGCDGKIFIRSSFRVIASAGNRYLVYCTNENVTELHEAERKKQSALEQLYAIMDNIDGGVTAIEFSEGKSHTLFMNNRFYSLFGYTKEQFEAEVGDARQLTHPDDRDKIVKTILNANITKEPFKLKYRAICRDGSVRKMCAHISFITNNSYSQLVQLSVTNDITDR